MATTISFHHAGGRYHNKLPSAVLAQNYQLFYVLTEIDSKKNEYALDDTNIGTTYLLLYYCAPGAVSKYLPGTTEITLPQRRECLMLMKCIGLSESSAPFVNLLADIASDPDFRPDGPISESIPLLLTYGSSAYERTKAVLQRKRRQELKSKGLVSLFSFCIFLCFLLIIVCLK